MKQMTRVQNIPVVFIYLILCYTVKLDLICSSAKIVLKETIWFQLMLPNANRLTLFTERGGETYSYLGNGIHIFMHLNAI